MATPKKKPDEKTGACRICGKTVPLTIRQAWDNTTRYLTGEHRDYRDQLRCPGSRFEVDERLVRASPSAVTPSPFAREPSPDEALHA